MARNRNTQTEASKSFIFQQLLAGMASERCEDQAPTASKPLRGYQLVGSRAAKGNFGKHGRREKYLARH
jgi:hypothetical protein